MRKEQLSEERSNNWTVQSLKKWLGLCKRLCVEKPDVPIVGI